MGFRSNRSTAPTGRQVGSTRIYKNKIPDIKLLLDQDIADAVEDATMEGVRATKAVMRRGHGRVYSRPGGKAHQASAPGESPAPDTGALKNSIEGRVNGMDGIFGTDSIYAEALEFGTSRMAARPFMVKGKDKAATRLRKRLKDFVAKAKAEVGP